MGRDFFRVRPDPDHGIRGTTTAKEFGRAFRKLVSDIALSKQSSRTLNSNEDIQKYFGTWTADERPSDRLGSFVPSDVVKGRSVASKAAGTQARTKSRKQPSISKTVLPKDFKVRFGNERLIDIRSELTKLRREQYPNAGAVLLRVFLELSVVHFLDTTGRLAEITARLSRKNTLPHGVPTMRQLLPEITRIAKEQLPASQARTIEKALRYDASAPFTISDLHGFVHSRAVPTDILNLPARVVVTPADASDRPRGVERREPTADDRPHDHHAPVRITKSIPA